MIENILTFCCRGSPPKGELSEVRSPIQLSGPLSPIHESLELESLNNHSRNTNNNEILKLQDLEADPENS